MVITEGHSLLLESEKQKVYKECVVDLLQISYKTAYLVLDSKILRRNKNEYT